MNTSTLVLHKDGSVSCFGSNSKFKFGSSDMEDVKVPRPIKSLTNIAKVSCGYWHSLALTHDGRVLSAGYNKYGELGREGSDSAFDYI